jgi:hypothetical protein
MALAVVAPLVPIFAVTECRLPCRITGAPRLHGFGGFLVVGEPDDVPATLGHIPQAHVHQPLDGAQVVRLVSESADRVTWHVTIGAVPVAPDERLDVQEAHAARQRQHGWTVGEVVAEFRPRHAGTPPWRSSVPSSLGRYKYRTR